MAKKEKNDSSLLLESFSKEILSLKEATAYLDVSESLLYKLTSTRKIKFYKPNKGRVYFKRVDLDQWMLQNEQAPTTFCMSNLKNVVK